MIQPIDEIPEDEIPETTLQGMPTTVPAVETAVEDAFGAIGASWGSQTERKEGEITKRYNLPEDLLTLPGMSNSGIPVGIIPLDLVAKDITKVVSILEEEIEQSVRAYCEQEWGARDFRPLREESSRAGQSRLYEAVMFVPGRRAESHEEEGEFGEFEVEDEAIIKAITSTPSEILFEEARTLRALQGTGVVPRFYCDNIQYSVDNRTFLPVIVMEKINGKTLNQHLDEKGFSERDLFVLFRDIARAIGKIHQAGYAHRDIKPDNIMITDDGEVKLVDLGIAAKIGEEPLSKDVGGTPEYFSPEHIANKVDIRMDIYSLGCVFYKIVTGKALHAPEVEGLRKETPQRVEAEVLRALYERMINESYMTTTEEGRASVFRSNKSKLNALQETKNNHLSNMITKCVRGNAKLRYQSCEELAQYIDVVIDFIDDKTRRASGDYQAANDTTLPSISQLIDEELDYCNDESAKIASRNYQDNIRAFPPRPLPRPETSAAI